MTKVKKRWWLLAAIVLLAAFLVTPLPYYLEMPGSAEKISQYVTVNHKKDRTKGSYMLVYVSVLQATPASFVASYVMPFTDLVSKEDMLGTSSAKDYDKIQQYYMDDAINEAKYVALKKAHHKVSRRYIGMYVMSITKGSTFKNILHVGDVVTSVNGRHYDSSQAFVKYLASLKPKSQIKLTYLHDGQEKTAQGKTTKLANTKRYGIGITLADRTKVSSDTSVQADMEGIGGPSAGLMLTLELYQQITGKNLRQGQKVAGTGTMNADGSVGDIGGIDKKVVSASKAGAKIFFAPNNPVSELEKKYDPSAMSNYAEAKKTAKKIHTKMKIVPVRTFDDALKYLQTHQIK